MRPTTLISLMVGATAVIFALPNEPDFDPRPPGPTVAEMQLIEHIRELAHAPEAIEAMADLRWRGTPPEPIDVIDPIATSGIGDADAPAPTGDAPSARLGTVLADALNVRAGPSGQEAVVGRLLQGQRVEITAEQGAWIKVSAAGSEGWAYARYLDVN